MIAEEEDVTLVVKRRACLTVLLAAAIVCSGCTTKTSAAYQDIPVVAASHAVRTDLKNDVTLTAELEPYYEVDVMAKEAGYIRHMLVDIGDHLKAGQLIVPTPSVIPPASEDYDLLEAAAQLASKPEDDKEAAN